MTITTGATFCLPCDTSQLGCCLLPYDSWQLAPEMNQHPLFIFHSFEKMDSTVQLLHTSNTFTASSPDWQTLVWGVISPIFILNSYKAYRRGKQPASWLSFMPAHRWLASPWSDPLGYPKGHKCFFKSLCIVTQGVITPGLERTSSCTSLCSCIQSHTAMAVTPHFLKHLRFG